MSFADELEVNPFYNHALSKQPYLQQVLTNGSVLCIPSVNTLPQTASTDRFLDLHILKPSPLYKGEYSTVWCNSSGEHNIVKLDDQGRSLIVTYAGGSNAIEVLYSEAAYIKGAKYFVWLIQRPLNKLEFQNGPSSRETLRRESTAVLKLNIENTSLPDIQTFLELSGVQYLHPVEKEIQHFKSKYIVLHSFLRDAANKLEAIANKCSYNGMLPVGFNKQTHAALISYIHHRTYNYIYPHVKECSRESDKKYEEQRSAMQGEKVLHQSQGRELNSWLAELNRATCPLQLISVLKLSLDEMCTPDSGLPTHKKPLSSDELIPLVIDTLLSRKDVCFPSLLLYIEIFGENLLHIHEAFEFTFATYRAAVLYISDYKFPASEPLISATVVDTAAEAAGQSSTAVQMTKPSQYKLPATSSAATSSADAMSAFKEYIKNFSEEKPFGYSCSIGDVPDRYELVALLAQTKI